MSLVKQTASGIYNLILGLVVTVKHVFKRAVTLQYPDERWEMPERSRGTIVLLSDPETGKLNCTACLLCEKACPVAAITIDRVKNEETKKFEPASFQIDTTVCCYCGLCEQACNFTAIKLTGKYEFSVMDKEKLLYKMDYLQDIGRDVKYEKKKKRAAKKAVKKPAAKPKPEASEDSDSEKTESSEKPESKTESEDKSAGTDNPEKDKE
jgi:NADH-quinone oxidoreductase subunit I